MTARLQTCSTSCSRWDESSTVVPPLPSSRTSSRTSFMPCGSRPLVGSSRMITSGRAEQGVGDSQALPHAVREAADLGVAASQQADGVEHLGDALLADLTAGRTDQPQITAGAHVGVEGGYLDEAAQVAQSGDPCPGHKVTGDLGVAARREDEAEDHADRRRLAGAVGTEKAEHLAAADGEVEVIDGQQLAEALGQAVGGQHDGAIVARLPVPDRRSQPRAHRGRRCRAARVRLVRAATRRPGLPGLRRSSPV